MRKLETFDWWSDLLHEKEELSLRELAEKYGRTPGAISGALKRCGISKVPAPPGPRRLRKMRPVSAALPPEAGTSRVAVRRLVRTPVQAAPVAIVAEDTSASDSRKGSKDALIMAHIAKVGNMPDSRLAAEIGVDGRTIASFRKRNNISVYRVTKDKGRVIKTRKRRSKIDPYLDMVGSNPDRSVAEAAGVTINAVRNYRKKNGIPPFRIGRPPKSLGRAVVATSEKRAKKALVEAKASVEKKSKGMAQTATQGLSVFEVVVQIGEEKVTRFVVGKDITIALAHSVSRAETVLGGKVVSLSWVGEHV